jgi:predicted dehydrogenase
MIKELPVQDTGQQYHITAPDHIFIQGRSHDGALLAAQVKMYSPVSAEFRLEISGTKGGLIITSGELDPNVRQAGVPGNMELYGASAVSSPFEQLNVPSSYSKVPATTLQTEAFNVPQLYRGFSERRSTNATGILDFDYAVIRHRLLDAIRDAAISGRRERVNI